MRFKVVKEYEGGGRQVCRNLDKGELISEALSALENLMKGRGLVKFSVTKEEEE